MPSYLVETYLARSQADERFVRERQARSAVKELTREGRPVQFERSIYVPEDEICFFVFHAPSAPDAADAAQRAGVDAIRVVEAISSVGARDTRRTTTNADPPEEQ